MTITDARLAPAAVDQLIGRSAAESDAFLPATPTEPAVLPEWLEEGVPPDPLAAVMGEHTAEEIATATGTADLSRLLAYFAGEAGHA